MTAQPETYEREASSKPYAIVVEDDPDIAALIKLHLCSEGYDVLIIADGLEAVKAASTLSGKRCDMVILDLMLPGADGYEACKAFREALGDNCGIIMLTAKNLSEDKVLGFDVGADDYLTKPFCVDEFKARVRAIQKRIRNHPKHEVKQLKFGDLIIDISSRRVSHEGNYVNLSPTEYRLLEFLALNQGEAFSRENLLHQVWGYTAQGYENTVNTTVNRLRLKLEKDQNNPFYVRTVRGFGYRFVAKDETQM